jgi:glycosyltransferase involved in cell wall biosynthesis
MQLTFSFCTFNRAQRLEKLVAAMRQQTAPVPFEILAIDNNSSDDTPAILDRLKRLPGPPLRVATERKAGIVPARNKALEEARHSDILVFMDDDELPLPGLLEAACRAVWVDKAECVGGRVKVKFEPHSRPEWLTDDLLPFLAEVDYGSEPFWISDSTTPIWTANIAYDMRLFRDHTGLRFDHRFNRKGETAGGGEDEFMFHALLTLKARIRYEPQMAVEHFIHPSRLHRRYFLRRHFAAGRRKALYGEESYDRMIAGIPPFLFPQAARQLARTASLLFRGKKQWLRQAMNFTHALGLIAGHYTRMRATQP